MKKLLMIAALATLGATAMAVPPNLGPAITGGVSPKGSTVEVRITANVVEGVAVNEVSPIDFGNLVRGMQEGTVSPVKPGRIHVKGANNGTVQLKIDKVKTDLAWTGANGTTDTTGTLDKIKDVKVIGLNTVEAPYTLNDNGELTHTLSASFDAYKTGDTNNLGPKQKLGSYVGTVIVTATTA